MAYTDNPVITTTPDYTTAMTHLRRTYALGDTVADYGPDQTLFFTYLSKLAKSPVAETKWKEREWTHQWQRRNFTATHTDAFGGVCVSGWKFKVDYNFEGKVHATEQYSPIFIVPGQVFRVGNYTYKILDTATINHCESDGTAGNAQKGKIDGDFINIATADVTAITASGAPAIDADDGTYGDGTVAGQLYVKGVIVGSQWSEGSTAPEGWRDELSSVEFNSQIFKTAIPLFSGSSMATQYAGIKDEFKRVFGEHVLSHKMDMENALLFNYGFYTDADNRMTWGIEPFIRTNAASNVFSLTYAGSGFDDMVDVMESFWKPEAAHSRNKLVLTSRKVISWLTKLGTSAGNSFLFNSLDGGDNSPYRANIQTGTSKFGRVPVTTISTAFGSFNFMAHSLMRGHAEDMALVIDMGNVKYRPLVGNGLSRDTYYETNIQANDLDGRKDQIITEAGLQVLNPTSHAILDFS